MKHICRVLLLSLLTLTINTISTQASDRVFRIATTGAADLEKNGVHVWVTTFADKMTKAGFDVRLYPSSSLGKEEERADLLRLGLLQMNLSGGREIELLEPYFSGVALKFLFDDYDHLNRFFRETPFLQEVNESLVKHNMRIVGTPFLGGMSGLFNTKRSVQSLNDLQDLRMRAMESDQLILLDSWGVAGVQVAWEEVPQALQTGIADGYINPPLVPIMFGHVGQIEYFTDLRIAPSYRSAVVSLKWLNGLSDPDKIAFSEAIQQADQVNWLWNVEIQKREMDILSKAGISVTTLAQSERQVFVDRARASYSKSASQEIINWITPMVDAVREKAK